uniref:uncharacterized protein LOC114593548 isoform X5 n=1 Tax=Podarcis muralis TaxID=64176 RepID=UPI00109F86B1|nr:uncharacterized protein LOC114593548 isoform X5 [Podarcis muralis]
MARKNKVCPLPESSPPPPRCRPLFERTSKAPRTSWPPQAKEKESPPEDDLIIEDLEEEQAETGGRNTKENMKWLIWKKMAGGRKNKENMKVWHIYSTILCMSTQNNRSGSRILH